MSINVDLLKRLCETPGIASREDRVRDLVIGEIEPLVDSVEVDTFGNAIGLKRGDGARRIMIAAHMDEIGFMVRFVDDDGFLRIQPVGGFDPRVLIAQRVIVHSSSGESMRGALSLQGKPIHVLAPDEIKPPKIDDLFVDLGMPAAEVKAKVEIGDMITLDRTAETLGGTFISKALDDRSGLFVMIEALRRVRSHRVDVLAVATTQEEVGLRGAGTAAFHLEPEFGIALDVTLAVDVPGQAKEQSITRLGGGAAIKVMDSSLICDPTLVQRFRAIAKREGIPHQMEILPRGGTDGGAIQRSRSGVRSITISIPCRYVHTVNEMVSLSDLDASVDLVARFIEEAHEVE